jgi:hypothetical protein
MLIVERPVRPSMPETGGHGALRAPDDSICSWPGFWHCLVPAMSGRELTIAGSLLGRLASPDAKDRRFGHV